MPGGAILYLMATVTEIGSLISRGPDIRGGRPRIAHANRVEIDADLESEARETEALEETVPCLTVLRRGIVRATVRNWATRTSSVPI